MKKAEAISILTASVRPREAKDRARYDEAVKKQISVKPILAKGEWRMSDLKKYVIKKEGYSTIVVNLTEREARVIENFLDWACLDDNFFIESVEEYEADKWGK